MTHQMEALLQPGRISMDETLKIAVIYGSDREGRLCDTIAAWLLSELRKVETLQIDVVDPLQLELPARLLSEDNATVAAFKARIAAAEGFIILTPEYNHSFPSILKHILDTAHVEWSRKPVAFVSYGGMAGGVRAVEQLRLIATELSMVSIRSSVALATPWNNLDSGTFRPPALVGKAVKTMVDDLSWWALALRMGRLETTQGG